MPIPPFDEHGFLAEGPVDEIRKLQVDVDNNLSRLEGISAGIA